VPYGKRMTQTKCARCLQLRKRSAPGAYSDASEARQWFTVCCKRVKSRLKKKPYNIKAFLNLRFQYIFHIIFKYLQINYYFNSGSSGYRGKTMDSRSFLRHSLKRTHTPFLIISLMYTHTLFFLRNFS